MATESVIVECARITKPDMDTIDRLARIELAARRGGRRTLLRNAAAPLVELIRLAGLASVLRVEVKGQPEERKQLCGVEEERDLRDPSA
jgi:hypothetical protein